MPKVYEGPSEINGTTIWAVMSCTSSKSKNVKTGPMCQLSFITTQHPYEAVKSGADAAVCGDCPARPVNKGYCYVGVERSIRAAWVSATKQAVVPVESVKILKSVKTVRLGTYGDPAAVPRGLLDKIIGRFQGHTGYTHQWLTNNSLRDIVMASVDSELEAKVAKARGWRYFRVKSPDAPMLVGEIECPAAKGLTTCDQCLLCDGKKSELDSRKNIVIDTHGVGGKKFTPSTNNLIQVGERTKGTP